MSQLHGCITFYYSVLQEVQAPYFLVSNYADLPDRLRANSFTFVILPPTMLDTFAYHKTYLLGKSNRDICFLEYMKKQHVINNYNTALSDNFFIFSLPSEYRKPVANCLQV
jgi:hypothetical protein